jgi:hypothetical protein
LIFCEEIDFYAWEKKNKTIGTKNKFMSISGCISFVDVAGFSTRSTHSSCTYPISSIVYVRAVSTALYLFFLRTRVSRVLTVHRYCVRTLGTNTQRTWFVVEKCTVEIDQPILLRTLVSSTNSTSVLRR